MSCFTTEEQRPDDGPVNITQTVGVWIRKMDCGDYEIYYDGKFLVSFGNWNEHITAYAMEEIYNYAFMAGQKDNQKTLRTALGLDNA